MYSIIEKMNTEQSMYAYLKEGCTDEKQKKIIYYNRVIDAGELLRLIDNTAGFLQSLGVKKGVPVGIALPNIPEAVIALYAVNAAGGIANLIHPKTGGQALVKLLNATSTKIVFMFDLLYKDRRKELEDAGIKVIICRASNFMRGFLKLAVSLYEPRIKGALLFKNVCGTFTSAGVDGEAPAVYIHSGGTSGEPKTVVHSNASFNRLSSAIIDTVYEGRPPYNKTDCMLMALPVFHGFGLGVSVHTLIPRTHIVMLPRFKAGEALKLIKKHKITHLAGVPVMYKKMLEHKEFSGDLSFLTHIFCGGDSLSPDFKKKFDSRLKALGSSAEICEGYGLTETAAVFALSRNGETRYRSQGRPLINNRVRVIGEDGKEVQTGEIGELYLQSPSLMQCYLNDPEATEKALVDCPGGKWLKTGDLGSVDKDGYIYFKERQKRSLKIAAVNIFPSEVEEVVNSLPEVKDCCVARIAREGKSCTKLYVALKDKIEWSGKLEEKIKTTIGESLIKYAVPKEIEVVERIHRTPHAKLDYLRYEREN